MPETTIARLGGLTRAAMYDGTAVTDKARTSFTASFVDGHGCSVCPAIEIPVDLAPAERDRRAAVLRRLHYVRIASLPRGTKKTAAPATGATVEKEVDRVSDHHHQPE